MNAFASRHAIIIGGGASGVLLAYQLLQRSTPDFRITLIEKRPEVGRGLAYHTGNPEHVLNVRVANMSALPDEPDHFWRWLTSREGVPPPCPDPLLFRATGHLRRLHRRPADDVQRTLDAPPFDRSGHLRRRQRRSGPGHGPIG
jgi:uncharacterized NAD(P)/FAD-binding protein YdhS